MRRRRGRAMMEQLDKLVNGPLSLRDLIERNEREIERLRRSRDRLFPIIVAMWGILIGYCIEQLIAVAQR